MAQDKNLIVPKTRGEELQHYFRAEKAEKNEGNESFFQFLSSSLQWIYIFLCFH